MLNSLVVCTVAVLLDRLLGEPKRFHPLVGFGRVASTVEARLNRQNSRSRSAGALTLVLLLTPVLLAVLLQWWLPGLLWLLVELVVVYLALGLRSLADHAQAVSEPLSRGDMDRAREQLARLVSRDVEALDESGLAAGATESVLENGSDAVVATLFWFLVAGVPGVIAHRLVNTLDAMWGYRTERFERFGWAAARLDDVLGWLPARLTALAYALLGRTAPALRCWQTQAGQCQSPNAGAVMAAGAGALGLRLGGPARYHGKLRPRPWLGEGAAPDADSPMYALVLLGRSVLVLLALAWLGVGLWLWFTAAG